MSEKDSGFRPMEDPNGDLERGLIDDYLRLHGRDPELLQLSPPERTKALLRAAAMHVSGRLAEFEARAHYVQAIHRKD